MPSLPDTRQISAAEWAERKRRIIELYTTQKRKLKGPGGVIETMNNEHFVATISQYEHQFRKWNLCKNRRAAKRTVIMPEVQSEEGTIEVNNQPSSGGVLQRTQRCVTSIRHQLAFHEFNGTSQVGGEHVSELDFERHVQYAATDSTAFIDAGTDRATWDQNVQPCTGTNDNNYILMSNSLDFLLVPHGSSNDGDSFNVESASRDFINNDDRIVRSSFNTPPASQNFGGVSGLAEYLGPPQPQSNNSAHGMDRSFTNNVYHAVLAPFHPPLPIVLFSRRDWLQKPLPSAQLIDMFIKHIYLGSPMSSTSGSLKKLGDPNFLFKFSNIVNERRPNTFIRHRTVVSVSKTLNSMETFVSEDWGQLTRLSNDASREARFDCRLIASITNGFAGLENIPAACVLKFLNRHHTMKELELVVFNTRSSSLIKSFGEKVFMAYLEADNVDAIQFLLRSRLVDANKAVCYHDGERYIPLEYAAKAQSFKVFKLFISWGTDVNKSFPRCNHSNTLSLLIDHLDSSLGIPSDNFLSSLDALISARAAVSISSIKRALKWRDSRVVVRLLQSFASQTPQEITREISLLEDIIGNLSNKDATNILKSIFVNCAKAREPNYLHQYNWKLEGALNKAIRREYDELAEVILRFMLQFGLRFEKMLPTKHEVVFEFVLKKYRDSSGDLELDQGTEGSDISTSHLGLGDENIVDSQNDASISNNLEGYEFGWSLGKALRAKNLERATQLLERHSELEFSQSRSFGADKYGLFNVEHAFKNALAYGLDEIAWKLLAIGLTVVVTPVSIPSHLPSLLLRVAIGRRRLDFVEAMIEFGISSCTNEFDGQKILEEALECSEGAIFDALFRTWYRPLRPSDRLYTLALEKGRPELFLVGIMETGKSR